MQKYFFLLIVLISTCCFSQKKDNYLQTSIAAMIKDFHGDVGVYVYDLKHNKIAAINADSIFPTASIVKIPILLGIMDKIRKNQLDYHQRLIYTDSLFYDEGDDILSRFKDSSAIELSKVMMLMLTISDNCASLWLQGLAGGGATINALLDTLGLKDTRVNSRTRGRENNRSVYGWGQTTPAEIAQLMKRIVNGEIFSKRNQR